MPASPRTKAMMNVLTDFIVVSPIQDKVCPQTSNKHTGDDKNSVCKLFSKSGRHSERGVFHRGQEGAPIGPEVACCRPLASAVDI
jgi:hypothetical protein